MLGRIAPGVALASMAALVLVGCSPAEPEPTASSAAPTTSTEPEANLGAATRAAWDAYQVLLGEFSAAPSSATADALEEVATPEFAEFLLGNFQEAADRRVHTEGARQTVSFELAEETSAGPSALVCVDMSGERLVGDEGDDLTPDDREPLQSHRVDFSSASDSSGFVVAGVVDFDESGAADPCRQ
jgi:hypothetical protein